MSASWTAEQADRYRANRCIECGEVNPGESLGRVFCGGPCKQRDYRRRKRQEATASRT